MIARRLAHGDNKAHTLLFSQASSLALPKIKQSEAALVRSIFVIALLPILSARRHSYVPIYPQVEKSRALMSSRARLIRGLR